MTQTDLLRDSLIGFSLPVVFSHKVSMVRRTGFEVVRITGSVMSMSGCWRSRNACLSVQWMVSSLTGDLTGY